MGVTMPTLSMGAGPPFELASSPPFATMQIAYKSACGPTGVGPKLSLLLWETKLVSLLVLCVRTQISEPARL